MASMAVVRGGEVFRPAGGGSAFGGLKGVLEIVIVIGFRNKNEDQEEDRDKDRNGNPGSSSLRKKAPSPEY